MDRKETEKMPSGRTFKYRLFRACERLSQMPSVAYTLGRKDLADWIAFSEIREREERDDLTLQLRAAGGNI